MKIKILSFIFFLYGYTILNAQIDKEFWFAAPEITAQHGDRPIFLRISTLESNKITVEIPATNKTLTVVNLPINGEVNIDLTPFITDIENMPFHVVNKKGLRISGVKPFFCYYNEASGNNPVIYNLKGNQALGNRFIIPTQTKFDALYLPQSIDIVSVEDNNLVEIIPTTNNGVSNALVPVNISLNRGETYSLRGRQLSDKFIGSQINSSKKIAVTISEESIKDGSAWDIVGDQLVPIDFFGNDYIIPKGLGVPEYVYILNSEPNTTLEINEISGTYTKVLNNVASYEEIELKGVTKITSNKPVLVYHLSGISNERAASIIPPSKCNGTRNVRFFRTSNLQFAVTIITSTRNISSFLINGNSNLLSAQEFTVVPGTNGELSYAVKSFTNGELPSGNFHTITNSTGNFTLGILNNNGLSAEYGYYTGFKGLDISDVIVCNGNSTIMDAGSYSTYLWDDGSKDRFRTITQNGTYFLTTTDANDNCSYTDTFDVLFSNSFENGIEATICQGDTFFFKNKPYANTGIFYDSAFTQLGCDSVTKLRLTVIDRKTLNIDTILCDADYFRLAADTFYSSGNYIINLVSSEGCDSTINLKVAFNNSSFDSSEIVFCKGKSFVWNGIIVDTAGQYDITFTKSNGCDSNKFLRAIYSEVPNLKIDIQLIDSCNKKLFRFFDSTDYQNFNLSQNLLLINDKVFDFENNSLNEFDSFGFQVIKKIVETDVGCREELTLTKLVSPPLEEADFTTCYNQLFYTKKDLIDSLRVNGVWTTQPIIKTENVDRLDIQIIYKNKCTKYLTLDTLYNFDIKIPNAFTPNNDDINDEFKFVYPNFIDIENFTIEIYNRWGQKIFESNNPNFSWNGFFNSKEVMDGSYLYFVNIDYFCGNKIDKKILKGLVEVLK
jgi:gliding motility-associated-like protein